MKYNLSEVVELIKERRTIFPELYSTRIVQKEIVENLLNSAIWAPTHGKTQPWRFKVLMGEATMQLADLQQAFYKRNTPEEQFSQSKYDRFRNRAERTSAIICLGMKRQVEATIPEIEEVMAVACAAQNLMLHATAYGLGSYWNSGKVVFTSEAKSFMGLEDTDQVLGFIYLGYPTGDWPKSHRKPIEFVTTWEG
jgi:nitroreductase